MTHAAQRPEVIIERVVNSTGDIERCLVKIGTHSLDAELSESSSELHWRVSSVTGIDLTVKEVMVVTRASLAQVEREAQRLGAVLHGLPYGALAQLNDGLTFWIKSNGELVWTESMVVGSDPSQIYPGYVADIDQIDTDELFAVAQSIRTWLTDPVIEHADPEWLRATEIKT